MSKYIENIVLLDNEVYIISRMIHFRNWLEILDFSFHGICQRTFLSLKFDDHSVGLVYFVPLYERLEGHEKLGFQSMNWKIIFTSYKVLEIHRG